MRKGRAVYRNPFPHYMVYDYCQIFCCFGFTGKNSGTQRTSTSIECNYGFNEERAESRLWRFCKQSNALPVDRLVMAKHLCEAVRLVPSEVADEVQRRMDIQTLRENVCSGFNVPISSTVGRQIYFPCYASARDIHHFSYCLPNDMFYNVDLKNTYFERLPGVKRKPRNTGTDLSVHRYFFTRAELRYNIMLRKCRGLSFRTRKLLLQCRPFDIPVEYA
ncbi:unnamed protein product [Soboliphyme baturini]|uniref:Uncharacterized protein n=1 Tax=Soboliphyme baturini TaxID=241478 RepID=A0A183I961_9BILA|nr:unnamed protein product [Soboliphyme baturini]